MSTPDSKSCVVLVPTAGPIEPRCEEGLRALERRGYEVRRVPGFSAIDFGRSVMACDALRAGFNELLWIDSDIAFNPDDVDKLRLHHLPFVCGVYPKKGCREFACEFTAGTPSVGFGGAGGLTEVRYTGFGFALTRRTVYETIQEKLNLPECNQRFGHPIVPYFLPLLVADGPGRQWYLAEDYAFCERAKQAGIPILADTSIRLWHVGSYAYGWEDAGADKDRFAAYTFHINRPAPLPAGEYTQDWFTRHIPLWTQLLVPLKGKPVQALEVGVFEGLSSVWLLENILTHPAATLTYVDTFQGGSDHAGMDLSGLEERFLKNTERFRDKLIGLKGRSRDKLRQLPHGQFDLAYIDGSHEAADVLADAILVWPLVKLGGLVGFDDYQWQGFAEPQRNPGPAIDAFLSATRGRYDLLHKGYQVWLRKIS